MRSTGMPMAPPPSGWRGAGRGHGRSGDHILLSPALSTWSYDVVHTNSEFAAQLTDHDPGVVRLTF